MATLLPKLGLEKSQVFLTQLLLNLLQTKLQLIWVKMEMRQVGFYWNSIKSNWGLTLL